MIAMQYSFTLPADYEMDIIRRRIAERGHFTDDFPLLGFKAYLYAERAQGRSRDNLYAPFYLWDDNEGMNAFLGGPGFAALVASFGRPSISVWSVWHAQRPSDPGSARYATREVVAIPLEASLETWREAEMARLKQDMAVRDAIGGVVAFEPTTWALVRFRLWVRPPASLDAEGAQCYQIGHVSMPAKALGHNHAPIQRASADHVAASA